MFSFNIVMLIVGIITWDLRIFSIYYLLVTRIICPRNECKFTLSKVKKYNGFLKWPPTAFISALISRKKYEISV